MPDDPEKAPRQVGQRRQERRRPGVNQCRQPRSHVLNKRRAHGETPLVNERDPAAQSGTTRDEIQPLAIDPIIRVPGFVRPPEVGSLFVAGAEY